MRLLLVEDNDRLSSLLETGLGAAGFEVDLVTSGADALAVAAGTQYPVLVLDLGLPDEDGLDVLRQLRGRGDATPVLVLTARNGLQDRVRGLQAGADDYLGKPFALEELVARLQALLRRPGNLLGQRLGVGNVVLDTEARQVYVEEVPQALSAREISVLELLLRRSGRVVSKKLVEDQLFGLSGEVGSNAVEVYVHRLRKQLAEAGATAQIHTVRGVGYMIMAGK
ncbi:MAG TPA: response regulator transcription factor [Aliidongia sp.]|nr:response regulator transcription factor [Aliidongia sp.]